MSSGSYFPPPVKGAPIPKKASPRHWFSWFSWSPEPREPGQDHRPLFVRQVALQIDTGRRASGRFRRIADVADRGLGRFIW
jgi:hypothetical protein